MTTQTNPTTKRSANFFKGVKSELKKVNWPNRKDMISYTTVVVVMCTVMSMFLWAVDSLFTSGLNLFL
jgi:preprotein translocase subunit SecE